MSAESENVLLNFFGKGKGALQATEGTDLYVCIVYSCQELPDIQTIATELAPDVPFVLFNLKLDTLRGDLVLPVPSVIW